jgi:hypothetical protein
MPNDHAGQTVIASEFIKQIDTSEEVPIPTEGVWEITTKNSVYIYDADNKTICGGIAGEEPRKCVINGTSFGGSMVKVGVLIPGARLNVTIEGYDGWASTSPMQSLRPLVSDAPASVNTERNEGEDASTKKENA